MRHIEAGFWHRSFARAAADSSAEYTVGAGIVKAILKCPPWGVRLESWTGLCREPEALPVFERTQ